MSTPLAQLFDHVINDPDARARFAGSPEDFLRDHGYNDLDASDVQEALFVLADGSAPSDAARLIDGGRAIDSVDDPDDGVAGAAAALGAALRSMAGFDVDLDPGRLDGLDDTDDPADDQADHELQHVDPDDADDSDDSEDSDESETADVDQRGGIASAFDDVSTDDGEQTRLDELDDAMDDELDALADVFDDVHGLRQADESFAAPDAAPTLPDDEVDDGWNDIVY